jgi:hypothetical protein
VPIQRTRWVARREVDRGELDHGGDQWCACERLRQGAQACRAVNAKSWTRDLSGSDRFRGSALPLARVWWDLQLFSDEVSVPASAEPRTWELPSYVKLLQTWTSAQLLEGRGPVSSALSVAEAASSQGHWVRIHTLAAQ